MSFSSPLSFILPRLFFSFSFFILTYSRASYMMSFTVPHQTVANSANLGTAGYVFLSVLAFAVVLIVLFRPPFWRLVTYVEAMHSPAMNNGLFCLTLILVFLCAWTTALLGLGTYLFYSQIQYDTLYFTVAEVLA